MKRLILPVLFLLALGANAQVRINDATLVLEAMEKRYPGYQRAVDATFEKNLALMQQKGDGSQETLTIPVVIHIVWKEDEENLSDELIESQMVVLNEAYSRTNADTLNLRSVFEPVAGNPNIQFQLEQVVRVESQTDFQIDLFGGTLVDAVKDSLLGGSNAWDPSLYLNIWVVNVQGDGVFIPDDALFGYAYPPADLENWPPGSNAPAPGLEGVVVHFKCFGVGNPNEIENPNTGMTMELSGKTAVHEVGHFLGLRHTAGDPGFGQDGCLVDDGMDDTPLQGVASNFDCDEDSNTCEDSPFDFPDMIENYMDYSEESCQNSFTQDQSNFMYTVLQESWPGLIVTSVNEVIKIPVKMSPNPTAGDVNYTFPENVGKVRYVELYNQLGQLIKSINSPAGKLDYTDVSPGFYIVGFHFDGGVSSQRLVIQ
jgi:hypothetical protein